MFYFMIFLSCIEMQLLEAKDFLEDKVFTTLWNSWPDGIKSGAIRRLK